MVKSKNLFYVRVPRKKRQKVCKETVLLKYVRLTFGGAQRSRLDQAKRTSESHKVD